MHHSIIHACMLITLLIVVFRFSSDRPQYYYGDITIQHSIFLDSLRFFINYYVTPFNSRFQTQWADCSAIHGRINSLSHSIQPEHVHTTPPKHDASEGRRSGCGDYQSHTSVLNSTMNGLTPPLPFTPSWQRDSIKYFHLNPQMALAIKFELLPTTRGFLKFVVPLWMHSWSTRHRRRGNVKNWTSVQCTEDGTDSLK